MKKRLLGLLILFGIFNLHGQTYTIGLRFYASSDNCHAGRFNWSLKGDNTTIDSFEIGGNSFGIVDENYTYYNVSNYSNYSLSLNAHCIPLSNATLDCSISQKVNKTREELILGHRMRINSCNGYVYTTRFRPNMKINRTDTQNPPEICMGNQLSLHAFPTTGTGVFPPIAYNWQYSTNGNTWEDIGILSHSLKKTLQEILGNNHRNYFNQNIYFRLGRHGVAYSSPITVFYSSCGPVLEVVEGKSTSCTNSKDGWFRLQFDRLINSVDIMDLQYFPLLNNGQLGPQEQKFINREDFQQIGSKYYYNWKPKEDNIDVEPGNYIIKYQYRKGGNVPAGFEQYPNTIVIGRPSAVTFNTSHNDISCASGQGTSNNGRISISATGGTSSYQYKINSGNWTAFSGSSINLSRGPGSYTIQVQDSNGCTATSSGSTSVTQTIDPVTPITITNPLIINATQSNNNGSIVVTVGGGNNGYTYSWSGPSGYTATSKDIASLIAGTYTLTVRDAKNCAVSESFTVNAFDFAINTHTDVSCGNTNITDDDGSIRAQAQNGIANYSYQLLKRNTSNIYLPLGTAQLLTPAQEFSVTGLSQGFYRITVTDNNGSGRTITTDTQINIPPVFSFTTTKTDVICKGQATGSINLTITGGNTGAHTITWTSNGITYNTEDLSGVPAGLYTLSLTDAKGCTPVNTTLDYFVEITEPPTAVTATIPPAGVQPPTFNGASDGSIDIDIAGGQPPYTYLWTKNGEPIFIRNTQDISALSDGTYNITVTDNIGCTHQILNILVQEPDPLLVNITLETEILCFQGTNNTGALRANPTGGVTTPSTPYTYQWYTLDTSNTYIPIARVSSVESALSPGFYRVAVTDNNNITTLSDPFELQGKPEIVIAAINTTTVNCFAGNDGTININASGGTGTLQYSIDNGNSYQLSNQFLNLAGDTYQVIIKDDNGCQTTMQQHTVDTPSDPLLITPTQTNVLIFGQNTGAIDITVTGGNGGYTYTWSGPNGFSSTDKDIANLPAGTYNLTVRDNRFTTTTDNAGCTTTATYTITQPDQLLVSLDYQNPNTDLKCHGDDNARILASVTGGIQPYTYTWSKETVVGSGIFNPLTDTSALLIGADAGNYQIQITDTGNATAIDTFEITHPDPLQINNTTTNVICFGDATGAIDITIAGGTPPYTINWNTGETTEDLQNIIAANYTVVVQDDLGCTLEKVIPVQHIYQELAIRNLIVNDVSTFDGNDGSIDITIEGGLPPYTINWTKVSNNTSIGTTSSINNLTADDYKIVITEANGCTIEQTYTVTEPDIVVATITNPVCKGNCDGTIALVVNQGIGTYTYSWNNGENSQTITGLCAGTYSVTIEGFGNRILERTYTLVDPQPLIIDLGQDKTLCKDQQYPIDVTINDPMATYQWHADNGFSATTPAVTLSKSGNYTVEVTTALGCTSTDTIKINALENQIDAEFLISSDLFVNQPFTIVDVSNPLPDTIEWILPKQATIIENTQEYAQIKFEQIGEYQISMKTRVGDCEEMFTKKITIREAAFNKDPQNKEGLQKYLIYPNPSKGNFTIALAFEKQTPISFKLFSVANNALLYQYQNQGKKEYTTPFNLKEKLPAGVYFLQLETPQKSYVRKIVVE